MSGEWVHAGWGGASESGVTHTNSKEAAGGGEPYAYL